MGVIRGPLPLMASTQTELCNLALSLIGNEGVQISDFDTDTGKAARQCRLHYQPTLDELVRIHSWNCTKARTRLNLKSVTVSGTNVSNYELSFLQMENERPLYSYSTGVAFIKCFYDGAGTWKLTDDGLATNDEWTVASTDYFPPTTGWSEGTANQAGTIPTLAYSEPEFGFNYEFILPSNSIRPLHLTPDQSSYTFLRPIAEWTVETGSVLTNNLEAWLLYIKDPEPADMDPMFAQAFYTMLAIKLCTPLAGPNKTNIKSELHTQLHNFILPEARRVNSFEGLQLPVSDSEWLEATMSSQSRYGAGLPPFAQSSYGTFNW